MNRRHNQTWTIGICKHAHRPGTTFIQTRRRKSGSSRNGASFNSPTMEHRNGNGNSNGAGQHKRFGRTSHIMLKLAGINGALADTASFANSGKKPGLEIWRVEKLKLVSVPVSEYGKLYTFDAYVLLYTCPSEKYQHHIHFWQGEACSADETTVAAYKVVELGGCLGTPWTLEYREAQGHESEQFMSYFKCGVRYIEGSMASEPSLELESEGPIKRLYKIKGKHNCRAIQVEFSPYSLNQSEVFVLDAGWNIYLWIGPKSTRCDRLKGAEFGSQLRDDEHRGQAYVQVVDQTWDSDGQFFSEFGDSGPCRMVKETDERSAPDWQHERREPDDIKLFKVMDKCGKLEARDVRTRPFSKKLLDSNESFVLDLGNGGVFAWVGKQCPTADTIEIWKLALEYLRFQDYPCWTPICRVRDGFEPAAFKQAFQVWVDGKGAGDSRNRGANGDADGCHAGPIKARDYVPDDGTGEVQIWRVENFYMAPVDKTQYGRFYSADCYVILYRHVDKEKERGIVYIWQGANSVPEERASSLAMASKVDSKEMNGQAVVMRVVQNREPAHFLKVFEQKMVVLMGGHRTGFKNVNEADCYDTDGIRLFQVKEGRVIQVAEKAASLTSNDVFILETPRTTFLWHGKTASEEAKRASRDCARRVVPLRNPHIVEEGMEPDEFWHAIGGPLLPKHANKHALPQGPSCDHAIRLFHVTNSPGYFRVEEVADFDQRDLFEDDVMILDAFDEIFVWIGCNANENEKQNAVKMAVEYLRTDPYFRPGDNTLVVAVKQGFEWRPFIEHFRGGWQNDMWNFVISYDDLKKQFTDTNGKLAKMAEVMKRSDQTYPLEVLMGREVPEGVDPGRKEFHLSEDEFQRVFQLTRAEYMKLPQWKRVELKKKSGLF